MHDAPTSQVRVLYRTLNETFNEIGDTEADADMTAIIGTMRAASANQRHMLQVRRCIYTTALTLIVGAAFIGACIGLVERGATNFQTVETVGVEDDRHRQQELVKMEHWSPPPKPFANNSQFPFGELKHPWGLCVEAGAEQMMAFKKRRLTQMNGDIVVETPHMATCDATLESQQWQYYVPAKQIKNALGFCLIAQLYDVEHGRVHIAECNVTDQKQKWNHARDNVGHIWSVLHHGGVLHCIDVKNATRQGEPLMLRTCEDGNLQQRWNLGDAPWVPKEPVLTEHSRRYLPTACPNRFLAPPKPAGATDLNGIALEDTCFPPTTPKRSNHIFVIGDWGGVMAVGKGLITADARTSKFTKSRDFVWGVDDKAQLRVAYQMKLRALTSRPDYIINVGDNFYWGGVGTGGAYHGNGLLCGEFPSPSWGFSEQWTVIYENVYNGLGIDGVQWLGVLGNHDYGGFKFTAAWDQTIGYTWGPSERWMTPAQYWRAKVWYEDFSIDWFFVDTNFYDAGNDAKRGLCGYKHNSESVGHCPSGPANISNCKAWFTTLWQEQVEWLDDVLAQSTSEWQIIVTHFPPNFAMDNWTYLAPKHGIDLYIAGHVHHQATFPPGPGNILGDTPYIVSGGGGGITSEGLPSADGSDDMYGFMDIELGKHGLRIESISHGGQVRKNMTVHRLLPATTTTSTTSMTSTTVTSTTTSSTTTTTHLCSGFVDTWVKPWGFTPTDRCQQWLTNPIWGVGAKDFVNCSDGWQSHRCALTCCSRWGPGIIRIDEVLQRNHQCDDIKILTSPAPCSRNDTHGKAVAQCVNSIDECASLAAAHQDCGQTINYFGDSRGPGGNYPGLCGCVLHGRDCNGREQYGGIVASLPTPVRRSPVPDSRHNNSGTDPPTTTDAINSSLHHENRTVAPKASNASMFKALKVLRAG